MRSNLSHPIRSRAGLNGASLLILAVVLAAFIGAGSQAKASPVTVTFDNGRLSIGSIFNQRVVLPATDTFPSDDLPTPQRTDIQLTGDLNGDQVTFPATTNTGLQFPYMHLMHPTEAGLKIPLTLRLNDPGLTGTWDAATGRLDLSGKVDVIVVTGTGTNFPLPDSLDDLGVPPLGLFARCRVNDVQMDFSTANKSPITGEPFTGGFGVHGAITASWSGLPAATSENGGDCSELNAFLPEQGALWLSNGIVDPIPQKDPEPTCENTPSLCPDPSYTIIDDVRISPRKRKVRPGQRVPLKITVHNSGNAVATGQRVRIKANSRRVKVPKLVRLNVPADGSASKRIVAVVRRGAKGRIVVRAAAEGWSGNAVLKVQRKAKRRR